ncbi:MAG: hypothetical protein LIP23_05815, partial [Planctomycetes bacterium]|nr:hypothetical protein [Planctomycetota bacterium]
MIAPHILHPREYRNHQSWPTRRRWLWLVAIFLLAATRQAMPAQVPIGSAQDIADNSIVISGNYQINPGNEYTFTAPVNVYTSSAGNVTFTGDSLIADASVGRLTAGMVNIGGGTVAATGSAGAAGIHGIYSYRLSTQTGGTVDLYGGGATGSYGWFANRGYILADGVLNSRGGSAANAYGIYGSAYNLQVDGGTMNNYAGTVSGAHGARSNTVNINGGVVNAYGYTEANQSTSGAYGLYASNLNITGGVLNARSGTAAESRGAYFYTVNQSGGTVNLTGNAASLASGRNHAMYV